MCVKPVTQPRATFHAPLPPILPLCTTYCERHCQVPKLYSFLTRWVVDGVLPVSGDEAALQAAVAEHRQNWDMSVKLRACHYIDSPLVAVPKEGLDMSKIDPAGVAPAATRSNAVTLTPGYFGINTPRVIKGLIDNKVVVHSWTG